MPKPKAKSWILSTPGGIRTLDLLFPDLERPQRCHGLLPNRQFLGREVLLLGSCLNPNFILIEKSPLRLLIDESSR